MPVRFPVRTLTALTAALLPVAALAQAPVTPPPAPSAAEATQVTRLVVGDGRTHTLTVLDAETGNSLGGFGTPGKLSGLYAGPGGTLAYALHRDDHRVTVLHSGLGRVSHGDHDDLVLGAPHVLATLNTGPKPTHFFTHGDRIVIFNDGNGTSSLFGEATLGLTNDMTVLKAAQPDHGAPALLGDTLLVGMLALNRVDAFDVRGGQLLRSFPGCPGVHGEAVRANTAYFGCQDGVLAVTVAGKTLSSVKLTPPSGAPEGTRVGTVAAHDASARVYGNFGNGLVSWTAAARTLTALPLPAAPLKFVFSDDGKTLVVLTANGQLHRVDAGTARVTASLPVVAAFDAADKGAVRPALAVGGDRAYVTSPSTGEVLVVRLADLGVVRRVKVGGTPAFLALTGVSGTRH